MGYMHIITLYKCPEFFELFTEIYAMEKIHGTSTWLVYSSNNISYHSGGEKTNAFRAIFNDDFLNSQLEIIATLNNWAKIKVHGEAYGAKQQRMSARYGNILKFIVFDIHVENQDGTSYFLNIPEAEEIASKLNLEFVHYVKGPNTATWIEEQANLESVQAIRNGMGHHNREGVVVRPLVEAKFNNGDRAIAKHKNTEFWEQTMRPSLGECVKILNDAEQIVNEWVTDQRFNHVTDRVLRDKDNKKIERSDIKIFISLMIEDVKREAENEIVWSGQLKKLIGNKTALKVKNKFGFK